MNIVQGTRDRMSIARAKTMQMGAGVSAANWWEAGGAAGCVAAYKPKGSASLAASYTNLANPGTNDAAPGVAPTWDSTDGWTFDGTSQYLTGNLSIQPSVLSALVRFSGHSGTGWLFGVFTSDSGNHIIRIIPSLSGSVNYCNGEVSAQSAAPAITSGVLGIAGTKAYRNGVDEGLTLVGAGTVTKPIFIAARNSVVGSPFNFASVKIQAIAFYNQVLDATAMAAVASAMAAL